MANELQGVAGAIPCRPLNETLLLIEIPTVVAYSKYHFKLPDMPMVNYALDFSE